MTVRRIIYITGTRADYGLMRNLLKEIDEAEGVSISVCVTGMHLSSLYGNTIEEIKADKFRVCGIISVDVNNTSCLSMAKAIGTEIISMADLFKNEQPDMVLVLGDRGEMLAAAITAMYLNIPVVHIHGGERSGTVDEMIRHAISKLAHYHFVSTEESRQRLIRMGENEKFVFKVGAPGLDEIVSHQACDIDSFRNKHQIVSLKQIALLIFHPVVQEYKDVEFQFQNALRATLDSGLHVVCFEPNSDAGGQSIRKVINDFSSCQEITVIKHLKRQEYLDCLANVDIMIGNSSSGIIEAASFNLPVVNIGIRQNLRECSDNVIHTNTDYLNIYNAIILAKDKIGNIYTNVYGDGHTAKRCVQLLKSISLDKHILNKCNEY